jgi:hypothetical protein
MVELDPLIMKTETERHMLPRHPPLGITAAAALTVMPRQLRSRPHRRCWALRNDYGLSRRWPSRLVARVAEDCLRFPTVEVAF